MMPIVFCNAGETNIIKKIGGNLESRRHLEELGLVAGAEAVLVNQVDDNVIIKVRETRVALGKALAQKVMV